jgi:hypothetical protein
MRLAQTLHALGTRKLLTGLLVASALTGAAVGVGGRGPAVEPAHAASTDPPPPAPHAPGVFWGITTLTVSWTPVSGVAGYVVTIKANKSGQVKKYKNSIFPSNQAVIAKSALPAGGAGGYKIRVQAKAKNGQLSAYSSLPKLSPKKLIKPVVVKKGDNAAAKKAANVLHACMKDGVYMGAATAGVMVVAAFIPGINLTAAGILGGVSLAGGSETVGCVLKKIDPLS